MDARFSRIEEKVNELLRKIERLERQAQRDAERFAGLRLGVMLLFAIPVLIG